jgi:hypothetical protein
MIRLAYRFRFLKKLARLTAARVIPPKRVALVEDIVPTIRALVPLPSRWESSLQILTSFRKHGPTRPRNLQTG